MERKYKKENRIERERERDTNKQTFINKIYTTENISFIYIWNTCKIYDDT